MSWSKQTSSGSWSTSLNEAIRLTESGSERVTESGVLRVVCVSDSSGFSWPKADESSDIWSKA